MIPRPVPHQPVRRLRIQERDRAPADRVAREEVREGANLVAEAEGRAEVNLAVEVVEEEGAVAEPEAARVAIAATLRRPVLRIQQARKLRSLIQRALESGERTKNLK